MSEVSWLFEARVKHGKRADLEAAVTDLVEVARGEPGTLAYEWSIGADGATALYERYADSAAAVLHVENFEEQSGERLAAILEPVRTTLWGSPSDELKEMLSGPNSSFLSILGGFVR